MLAGCVAVGGAVLTAKALKHLYQRHCRTRTRLRSLQTAVQSSDMFSGISLKVAAVGAAVLAVPVGIISHLVADSGTPDGLPIVR